MHSIVAENNFVVLITYSNNIDKQPNNDHHGYHVNAEQIWKMVEVED